MPNIKTIRKLDKILGTNLVDIVYKQIGDQGENEDEDEYDENNNNNDQYDEEEDDEDYY